MDKAGFKADNGSQEEEKVTGRLSKLTRRLMGGPMGAAVQPAVDETEVLEESALRAKIGYLSAMELFRDFTPVEMQEIDRATRMQTCTAGRVFYSPEETGEVLFILKIRCGADLSNVARRSQTRHCAAPALLFLW